MGEMQNWSCKKCGYTKQLPDGCGMNGLNLRLIKKIFQEDEIREFLWALEEKKVTIYLLKQEIGYCDTCKDYMSIPVLEYTLHEGNKIIVRKACSTCGSEINVHARKEKCPKCNGELEKKKIGLWD